MKGICLVILFFRHLGDEGMQKRQVHLLYLFDLLIVIVSFVTVCKTIKTSCLNDHLTNTLLIKLTLDNHGGTIHSMAISFLRQKLYHIGYKSTLDIHLTWSEAMLLYTNTKIAFNVAAVKSLHYLYIY